MADDEVASILSGHAALWHPAALGVASSLPRLAMPYEHEDPTGEAIYAVPENPSLHLPDDWANRARTAGAGDDKDVRFRGEIVQLRHETIRHLRPRFRMHLPPPAHRRYRQGWQPR